MLSSIQCDLHLTAHLILHPAFPMHLVLPLLALLLHGGIKRGETAIAESHNIKDHHQVTTPHLLQVIPRVMDLHLLRTQILMVHNHHHHRTVRVLLSLQGGMEIHNHPVGQILRWLTLA